MTHFTRIMTIDEAQRQIAPLHLVASAEECAAVARRFDWLSVAGLSATLHFSGTGTLVRIQGQVQANITQSCVATARPITTRLNAPFAVRLVPLAQMEAEAEACEVELTADALDTIGYSDARFDVADILAETLALSLDPWPRSADADAWLAANGVLPETAAGPFAALAALKGNKG